LLARACGDFIFSIGRWLTLHPPGHVNSPDRSSYASTSAPRVTSGSILIGTAGWSLPRVHQVHFAQSGSHLERYAQVFRAAEINSSFYRPHRRELYAKWAAAVPDGFRFSVKIPKAITHELRLRDCTELFEQFLEAPMHGLDVKLGGLLVQLPPSAEYDDIVTRSFLAMLRERFDRDVALEPRHATWFTDDVDRVLREFSVARVAADPARVPEAAEPGGYEDTVYYRLHGSPRVYWSSYEDGYLDALAARLTEHARRAQRVWCIFDNTASGAAAGNALWVHGRV
jgi:uncharacterized protein YecE (DUF72 family)